MSEVAGTTRDSIDIRFEVDGKAFVAIDTPGVRKRKSLANDIEFYGLVGLNAASVALILCLCSLMRLRRSHEWTSNCGRDCRTSQACIFVINKWDLALEEGMTAEKWVDYLMKAFSSMRHVPIAILTAKDGKNIRKLLNLLRVFSNRQNGESVPAV